MKGIDVDNAAISEMYMEVGPMIRSRYGDDEEGDGALLDESVKLPRA